MPSFQPPLRRAQRNVLVVLVAMLAVAWAGVAAVGDGVTYGDDDVGHSCSKCCHCSSQRSCQDSPAGCKWFHYGDHSHCKPKYAPPHKNYLCAPAPKKYSRPSAPTKHLPPSPKSWPHRPVASENHTSAGARWSPKLDGSAYDPSTKDWASVVSACRDMGNHEKRLFNFWLRAAFHDSLAVDVTGCMMNPRQRCGGSDASLFLSVPEMLRPENAYDNFSTIAAKATLEIATFYDTGVADTLAVCSLVAIEELSGQRVKAIGAGGIKNLAVGRIDSMAPAPEGLLPGPEVTVNSFATFWRVRGFTMAEAMALMGSHSVIDDQDCYMGPEPGAWCNPDYMNCTADKLRMFKLENHYFQDSCTPNISIVKLIEPDDPLALADTPVVEMNEPELESLIKEETCKFSSKQFQDNARLQVMRAKMGLQPFDTEQPDNFTVLWSNRCLGGPGSSCPHSNRWFYTIADARLGLLCQAPRPTGIADQDDIRAAMRSYLHQPSWDVALVPAMLKMVTSFARWPPSGPLMIDGKECPSGYVPDQHCIARKGHNYVDVKCQGCGAAMGDAHCHKCCHCRTAFAGGSASKTEDTVIPRLQPAAPPPPLPPAMPTPPPLVATNATDLDINPCGTMFPDVPPSPYIDIEDVCPATDGVSVEVEGYPSSPFVLEPFQRPFRTPPEAQPVVEACNATAATNGGCMHGYFMNVVESVVDFGVQGCAGRLTRVLAYNGSVPGPTIRVPKGRQVLVRFTNQLSGLPPFTQFHPCGQGDRLGRPISVHFHGSASLAPYDGWAEDSICRDEVKDYVLPASRPHTGWYHDHQLDITTENAYAGLAGLHIVTDNTRVGGPGEPLGVNDMEECPMVISERVLDRNCQQRIEIEGVHLNNLYGDIVLVNGVPWPVYRPEPKWIRFRVLNAATSRPYLLRIVDNKGQEVGSRMCQVIASDGGFRPRPVQFPVKGLFMGVAERYEFVCDFSRQRGNTLYLWNVKDEDRMKGVPFFCHSHLVMKIVVGNACASPGPSCRAQLQLPAADVTTSLDVVLPDARVAEARRLAQQGFCTRSFKFGRRRGHWVINGEDWETRRIAADAPVNSFEIWCLEGGGGWFHPIHIHLVDFYILLRKQQGAYQTFELYEQEVPKDVVQLHPGSEVAILARWGPHRGEYMFHCHNLRHEDNEMMRSYLTGGNRSRPAALTGPRTPATYTFLGPTGILYDNYKDPRYDPAGPVPAARAPALTPAYLRTLLAKELYRVFYPGSQERSVLCNPAINPWLVFPCSPRG